MTYLKYRPGVPRLRGRGGRGGSCGRRRRCRHMVRWQRFRHGLKSRPHSRRHFHQFTSSITWHLVILPSRFASSAAAARFARPTGPYPHQDAETAPDKTPTDDQLRPSNRIFHMKNTLQSPIATIETLYSYLIHFHVYANDRRDGKRK